MHWFSSVVTELVNQLSYSSIFFLMALESSLFPVPAEAVMIPAGYLAATGQLNFWIVLLAGTFGSLA
jgi:membrane protein DedA with SNARE-associated domain